MSVSEGFKDSKRFENPEKFKIIAWKPNRYKINFENMYLKCSRRFSKILIFSRKNRNISKIESKTEISRKSNRKQKYLETRIPKVLKRFQKNKKKFQNVLRDSKSI